MRLMEAMLWCKVRGYIARLSRPGKKYWKSHLHFQYLPAVLSSEDRDAEDWKTFDPVEEESSPLTA